MLQFRGNIVWRFQLDVTIALEQKQQTQGPAFLSVLNKQIPLPSCWHSKEVRAETPEEQKPPNPPSPLPPALATQVLATPKSHLHTSASMPTAKKNYSPTSVSNKSLLMNVRGLRKQVTKQPKSSATEAQGCWNIPKPVRDVLQDVSQTPDEWWPHAHSVTSQMPSSSSSPTGPSGGSVYSDEKGDGNVTKENEDWQEA